MLHTMYHFGPNHPLFEYIAFVRPTPNTKWSMSIFYRMQKNIICYSYIRKHRLVPSQHFYPFEMESLTCWWHRRTYIFPCCVHTIESNQQRTKINCAQTISIFFYICFKCNVSVYVAHGCAFGLVCFFSLLCVCFFVAKFDAMSVHCSRCFIRTNNEP